MKQSGLKQIEYHSPFLSILIALVVASFVLTNTDDPVVGSSHVRLLAAETIAQQSTQTDVRELTIGAPIERELAGGEDHSYRIALTAGQYLHLVVEQKGIDLAFGLLDPDNRQIITSDGSTGAQGPESIMVVANVVGSYRVEVRARDKQAPAGHYAIRIEDLREATSRDRINVAAAKLFWEGNQLRDQGAANSLRQAIEKYKEATLLWRSVEDKSGEAKALTETGFVHGLLGEPPMALEFYRHALTLWRGAGNKQEIANALGNIGLTTVRLGKPQEAFEYFDQALVLWRALENSHGEATTLNNIGFAYDTVGERQKGLEYYFQALKLRRVAGDRAGEARTLNNIGVDYTILGEKEKALEYLEQSLPLRRELGDRRGEATTLHNIGRIYQDLSDRHNALTHFDQALQLRRMLGDRRGEAVTLNSIGAIYKDLGELPKALAYYDQALALNRVVSDPFSEAYTLSNIGSVYSKLGDPQKAFDHFNRSLALRRTVGDRYGEAYTLANIGDTYFSSREPEKALEYYHQALTLSRAVGDPGNESKVLHAIARVESGLGHLEKARTGIEAALDIIESIRARVVSPDLRGSYLEANQGAFDFYIDLLMRSHQEQPSAGRDIAAFAASERARALSLLELLAEARIDVRQGIAPALKQREKDVQSRISWVQSQLIQANSRPKPDQTKIAELDAEFKKAESESEQLQSEIRKKHPRYANLKYPAPLGLKAIQQLLDEKTVLLEYSLGKEASFLFAISKDDFLTARLPAAPLLTNHVSILREAVAAKPNRMTLSNYLQKAGSLYKDLIQPATRLLDGKEALIIVPDGILHYLPFEVLLQSDNGRRSQVDLRQLPYLVRNYSISYSPSATILANLRSPDHLTQTPGKTLLAFGDPVYGKTESEQTASTRSAVRSAFGESKPWELQSLPESRREVERISKLYPRTQVALFLGGQATEENVKNDEKPSQYRLVHFAVHALLNENKPQYSGLVLSLPRGKTGPTSAERVATSANAITGASTASNEANSLPTEDGLLQVYEIFNLKLNADLVVLSACETGLGKEIKGEGLVGLTQAFFYAGTSSLIVSLWKVQDRSTAELMVRFYQYLNESKFNKAESLRRAQLAMIRNGDFSHPYYWAGFVLIGQR